MKQRALLLAIALLVGRVAMAQVSAMANTHDASCGLANGSAQAMAMGGTGVYTYQWSTGDITDSVSGLAAGPYTVTVYSNPILSAADSAVFPFIISNLPTPPPIQISLGSNDTVCTGSSITLIATGGTGSYTWSGGDLSGSVNGSSITRTPGSGQFTYSVLSGTGTCTVSNTQSIRVVDVLASLINIVQPNCGLNNGTINCAGQGVDMRFTFTSGGANLQTSFSNTTLSNVAPGTYQFIVDDLVTGCSDTVNNIILTDQGGALPVIGNISVTPVACHGKNTGSIVVTVNNCAGGCTYAWSHDGTNQSSQANNLSAGSYTFSVASAGCGTVDTVVSVSQPADILAVQMTGVNAGCGSSGGRAYAQVTGGSSPYSFVWNDGSTQPDSLIGIVPPQLAGVTVTDANGCTATDTVSIIQGARPIGFISPGDTICGSDQNGRLQVIMKSNDGPFTYLWGGGATTSSLTGLTPGLYEVTVTNASGCSIILDTSVVGYETGLVISATRTDIYRGEEAGITVRALFPPSNVTWTPYIPGSEGDLSVYVKPQDTTIYIVKAELGRTCVSYDTIQINVLPDTFNLQVPNIFTPNNDGINDNFYLRIKIGVERVHIRIYDRWGSKVYESTDVDFKWNGTNQFSGNEVLQTGVFAYVMEYHKIGDSQPYVAEGNVSLVR
ncbi:MAG: gliding motility-associated C-terminal domain-containing protein [Chitinophagales bacterium]